MSTRQKSLLQIIIILLLFVMNAASQDFVHKRLFSGLGGNLCILFSEIPTGNVVNVSTTTVGTSFSFTSQEELKTASTLWGFNVDWLEYYFSEKISLSLTTFNGWAGTSNSESIEGLVHSENTLFNSTALIGNYHFLLSQSRLSNNELQNFYGYFGIGPAANTVDMRASATLSDGTQQEVTANYLPVAGIDFQIGMKGLWGSNQINLAMRLGFSLGNISTNDLTVKQNGIQVPSNRVNPSPYSPNYIMLLMSYDYGWF
jgi:hypothetical protein